MSDNILSNSAQQARDLFREDAARTPAEQAALDVINTHKWALWHAHDRDLAVMLLLSRQNLLRDRAYEQKQARFAINNAEAVARERRVDAVRITALDSLIEQASARLSTGDDPAEVAAWMKEVRAGIAHGGKS